MTDNEKAAYLRGRRDKACEVIQDCLLYTSDAADIKEWFDLDLSDSSLKYLTGQVEIENHFSKIADAIERRPGNGKS